MADLWFGLTVLSGLLVPGPDAEAQVRRFDGTWSVEVVTEQGDRDRAYRRHSIENGRARYGGPEAFAVNGQVRSNGTVDGQQAARGSDRANVTGRLQGDWEPDVEDVRRAKLFRPLERRERG